MSEITEKRTVTIPPCKIDKNLIKDLGELLENQNLQVEYNLNSKTKDIISHKISDFIESDWGKDLREIIIRVSKSVKIQFVFRHPNESEFSVSGKDATWVNGTAKCIEELFQKYRLNYSPLKTNFPLKFAFTTCISLILTYPIFLVVNSFYPENVFGAIAGTFLPWLYIEWGVYLLTQWLLPYFDYGEMLQKSVRKLIWFVLFGSGLVTAIILKYLGL